VSAFGDTLISRCKINEFFTISPTIELKKASSILKLFKKLYAESQKRPESAKNLLTLHIPKSTHPALVLSVTWHISRTPRSGRIQVA
jgi:hypothetical protein